MTELTDTPPAPKTIAEQATEAAAAAQRAADVAAVLAYRKWEAADRFEQARMRLTMNDTLERGRALNGQ